MVCGRTLLASLDASLTRSPRQKNDPNRCPSRGKRPSFQEDVHTCWGTPSSICWLIPACDGSPMKVLPKPLLLDGKPEAMVHQHRDLTVIAVVCTVGASVSALAVCHLIPRACVRLWDVVKAGSTSELRRKAAVRVVDSFRVRLSRSLPVFAAPRQAHHARHCRKYRMLSEWGGKAVALWRLDPPHRMA